MTQPEFPATLTNITGLEEKQGISSLINTVIAGNLLFLNSGVGHFSQPASSTEINFQAVGTFAANYFRQGQRLTYTRLHLPPNTLDQSPHCHPGGEIAIVRDGEYFDADLQGNPLHTYGHGSVIFYTKGSTHRPLSLHGADIDYLTFDGIVFGKGAEDLLAKMKNVPKTDERALEFALLWMVQNQEEQTRLRAQILQTLQ